MGDRRKAYVEVISSTDTEGKVTPLSIVWRDGTRYNISRVLGMTHCQSRKFVSGGDRYTVRVDGRDTYLYYENPRWFVEERV